VENLIKQIRPDLRKFIGYSSARRECASGKIFLNANESPWNNALGVKLSLPLNRYPDPQPVQLIEKMSSFYGANADEILVTRGSDEGIDLLMRLFCRAEKDSILICPPTYGMYEISAQLQGIKIVKVPLIKKAGFQLDIQALLKKWNARVKIVFLCSPNNPTGNILDAEKIFTMCEKFANRSFVVVDEAYIEYSAQKSLVKAIKTYKNLVVLRTFSKAFGLSGIRCGALMANANIIEWLRKIIAPYPIPLLTEAMAINAMREKNIRLVKKQIALIRQEREKLVNFFSSRPFVLKIWPSEANFILLEVKNAEKLLERCMSHGIILRNMTKKLGLKNGIRVSIGLPEENDKLIKVLQRDLT
jgi:histidinol-phosphate aminotransferase